MLFARRVVLYFVVMLCMILFGIFATITNILFSFKLMSKKWTRAFQVFCSKGVFWAASVFGLKHKVSGFDELEKGVPTLYLVQHTSVWETIFCFTYITNVTYILKEELLKIPVVRGAAKLTRAIGIERGRPTVALQKIIPEVAHTLSLGENLVIFPQGTRGKNIKGEDDFDSHPLKRGFLWICKNNPDLFVVPVVHNAHLFFGRNFTSFKKPGKINLRFLKPMQMKNKSNKEFYEEVVNAFKESSLF